MAKRKTRPLKEISKAPTALCALDPHAPLRAYWEKLYRDVYRISADFGQVLIPILPEVDGAYRHLFIPAGLTLTHALQIYREVLSAHDPRWSIWNGYPNLDGGVIDGDRNVITPHVVAVRDSVWTDAEYLGKSIPDADPERKIGMTLCERMVFGAVCLFEAKKHLDVDGVTICSGSRYSDGGVPCVTLHQNFCQIYIGKLPVHLAHAPKYGIRAVVTI